MEAHHIPLIVENVKGAQKWVGPARWNFGSFYLWGDVPALMPPVRAIKQHGSGAAWFDKALDQRRKEATGIKNGGGSWFGQNPDGKSWIRNPSADPRPSHGNSTSRRFAGAMIAKIPFALASHIAKTFAK